MADASRSFSPKHQVFSWLLVLGKWAWIGGILFFAARFIWQRGAVVQASLLQLPWWQIGAALLALALAKIGLVAAMALSTQRAGFVLSTPRCLAIYSYSQLAKYIPGSIWQFVGKAVLLSKDGYTVRQIRDAMLLETISEPLGALLLALGLGVFWLPWLPVAWAAWLPLGWALLLAFTLAAAMWFWLIRKKHSPDAWRRDWHFGWGMLLTQAGIWLALGTSFHCLRGFTNSHDWLHSMAWFAVAYVAGFAVPVAPAGLGVRESVLVFGLQGMVPMETAWVLAGIHRVLYIVMETAMAGAAWLWQRWSEPGVKNEA